LDGEKWASHTRTEPDLMQSVNYCTRGSCSICHVLS